MPKRLLAVVVVVLVSGCTGKAAEDPACAVLQGGCRKSSSPIAAILSQGSGGGYSLCTGALITSRMVLTAAHCVGAGPWDLQKFKVFSGGSLLPVKRMTSHPSWNGSVPAACDLALIELERESPAVPLALDMSTAVLPGVEAAVFSYDQSVAQSAYGAPPGNYGAAMMKVEDLHDWSFISSFVNPGHSVCDGNSGAPAVVRSPFGRPGIIGVTSFALDRCTAASKAGFIRVRSDENLEFIRREAPDVQLSY